MMMVQFSPCSLNHRSHPCPAISRDPSGWLAPTNQRRPPAACAHPWLPAFRLQGAAESRYMCRKALGVTSSFLLITLFCSSDTIFIHSFIRHFCPVNKHSSCLWFRSYANLLACLAALFDSSQPMISFIWIHYCQSAHIKLSTRNQD